MKQLLGLVTSLVALTALSACGSDGDDLDLSAAGAEGRAISLEAGCASCHGADGQGTVGPPFVGLAGSERPIQGLAEPVIADRNYLDESIREPAAKLVEGFNLPMPRTELTDDEIDAIIAYIEELAEVEP